MIGIEIKELRVLNRKTRREFSEITGISQSRLYRLEHGLTKPRQTEINILNQYLNKIFLQTINSVRNSLNRRSRIELLNDMRKRSNSL